MHCSGKGNEQYCHALDVVSCLVLASIILNLNLNKNDPVPGFALQPKKLIFPSSSLTHWTKTLHYSLGQDYIHSTPPWPVFTFAQKATDMVSKRNCFNLVLKVLGDSQRNQFGRNLLHTLACNFLVFYIIFTSPNAHRHQRQTFGVSLDFMFASSPNI